MLFQHRKLIHHSIQQLAQMEGAQHQEQWQATHESRARRVTSSYQQSRTKNTRECHAELLKSHAIPQLPLIANGYDKLNKLFGISWVPCYIWQSSTTTNYNFNCIKRYRISEYKLSHLKFYWEMFYVCKRCKHMTLLSLALVAWTGCWNKIKSI